MKGNRNTRWEVLITRQDGTATGIYPVGGRVDYDIGRASLAGGSFTTTHDLGELVGARVYPIWTVNGARFSMGEFQATADPAKLTGSDRQWTVEFIDPTVRLSYTKIQQPLIYPRATNAVRAARSRLHSLGLDAAIPDSDITLRVALAFDRMASEQEIVGKLLEAARFTGVRARGSELVAERALAPDELPQDSWSLSEGEDSVQVVDYTYDSDHLIVPNRVQVETRGDNERDPLIGVAMDRRTTRWSYERRGFWLDADPREIALVSETTTQQDVNAQARRILLELMARAERLVVRHAWLPTVKAGSVGYFRSIEYPKTTGHWQVEATTVDMVPTSLATSTLRRVVRL